MARSKKTGRPRKPHIASWGEHINGLRKRRDGRWIIVDAGKTFVEADERRAVARFRRWEAEQQGESVIDLEVSIEAFESRSGVIEAFESGASISGDMRGNQWVGVEVSEVLLWAWLREQLISRPEYVADQVGIPEVARLADLPRSAHSPTIQFIGQLYHDKSDVQRKQRRQVQLFWGDFAKWMESHDVTTLRQLTPALAADYAHDVQAQAKGKRNGQGGSAKYLKNRFMSIRGVINFARKRGEHPADVRHALDCCAVLQSPKRTGSRAPHPINREDFHRLLEHATEPRMRALLLVMLNLCMYPSEALALDWGELDLDKRTVVTKRGKTSVIRVGVLWPRTIDAIITLRPSTPTEDAPVFLSKLGNRWSVKTTNAQYRKLRTRVDVDESVKCGDCRDGAYTAAIESGADLTHAKLLAGHSVGISDYYVMRNPSMVADAIEGIESIYFGTT